MDDKDPHGPGDPGPGRARGHGDGPPPPPSSVSISIPEGANYSGEETKQSISKDGAPPPLSQGRSEGFSPPPPTPGQTAGRPIQECADSGGEKTKQPVSRDEKVSNGLYTCYVIFITKCVQDPVDVMDLSDDNKDHVEDPLGVRKRKCSVEIEEFGAVMVRPTKI